MARINIEECWWSDPRRDYLRRLLGTETQDQVVIRAWRLAQEYWSKGKLIPAYTYFVLEGAEALIKAGLARLHESEEPNSNQVEANAVNLNTCFVYVRGSSEYLSWTRDRREAARAGGLKSAETRRRKAQAKANQIEASASKSNQTQASGSGSGSFSGSYKNKDSIGETAVAVTPSKDLSENEQKNSLARTIDKEVQNQKAKEFVGAYVKAYQSRFPDCRPEDLNDGKVRGQILNWIKEYPLDRACQLIQVYFQMDSKWFGTKGYDFLTFRNNLNKIGQALDSGSDPDGNQINWERLWAKIGAGA
jgi:hypothetical protein